MRRNNISLERLCRQSDILGKPVVAISPSGLDQIKISIGRVDSDDEYIEIRTIVVDKTDSAIYFAKYLAMVIDTNFIYEIRVFKNGSSECVRIFQDDKKISNEEEEIMYE